ncbi:hypothetical protein BHE74_00011859, partial [Ensete ventricosum]
TDLINALPDCKQGARLIIFVSDNNLSEIIPSRIGQLSALRALDLFSNLLEVNITEAYFSKLTNLTYLDISHNSLSVILPNDWLPPFNANLIYMSSCHLETKFLAWIQTQIDLQHVSLSGNNIDGSFPSFFCNLIYLQVLDLSNNNLSGEISKCHKSFSTSLQFLHLKHNNLSRRFLFFLKHYEQFVIILSLRSNLFYGLITVHIANLTSFQDLDLSSNNFSSSIPSSLGNCTAMVEGLFFLNLSKNHLRGIIPENIRSMKQLDLSMNNLTGDVPSSFSFLSFLGHLISLTITYQEEFQLPVVKDRPLSMTHQSMMLK